MSTAEPSRRSVLLAAVICEGALAVVALLLGLLMLRPPLAQISWSLAGVGWGLAATVPLVVMLLLMTRFPVGPLKQLKDIVEQLVVPLFRQSSLAELALVSLLAGLGEEMLFRGVVQAAATNFLGSPGAGLALASLAFGLAHPITRTYAVLAALIGVYLGLLWLWTGDEPSQGNLLPPIVAHAAYDFFALVYLTRRGAAAGNAPFTRPSERETVS